MFHRIQNSWVCIFPIFLRFYIYFISSLFNASRAPGPKCNFFLHLGPIAQPEGDRPPVAQARGDRGIVLKFFETAIYFWNLNFFKYKNEKIPFLAQLTWVGPARSSKKSRYRISKRRRRFYPESYLSFGRIFSIYLPMYKIRAMFTGRPIQTRFHSE